MKAFLNKRGIYYLEYINGIAVGVPSGTYIVSGDLIFFNLNSSVYIYKGMYMNASRPIFELLAVSYG